MALAVQRHHGSAAVAASLALAAARCLQWQQRGGKRNDTVVVALLHWRWLAAAMEGN
jgi:hypothetical protein